MPIDTKTARANQTGVKRTAKKAVETKKDASNVIDRAIALPVQFMNEVMEESCNELLEELDPLKVELKNEMKREMLKAVKGGVEQYRNFFSQTLESTVMEACLLPGDDQEIIDVSATSV